MLSPASVLLDAQGDHDHAHQGADLLTPNGRFQVALALLGRAEAVDEDGAHQALHGRDRGQAERARRQLFVEDAGGLEVGALATYVLGVAKTEIAEFGQPLRNRPPDATPRPSNQGDVARQRLLRHLSSLNRPIPG